MVYFERSTKLIFVAVVAGLLLFFLHYTGLLSPVERTLVFVTKPIIKMFYSGSSWVGGNYLEFRSKKELQQENKELKDEVRQLLIEKNKFLTETEENIFLRQQLNFVQANNRSTEIARVVGWSADKTRNALIIDKGTKQGLQAGQAVLADGAVMIGKIIEVYKSHALVLLLNDDSSRAAAKIQNGQKTVGLIEGEFGLGLKMELIPQTENIKEKDIVVSSGLEEAVPAGLLIGQVEKIFQKPEELFQTASVRALVDYAKVTMVNVIKIERND